MVGVIIVLSIVVVGALGGVGYLLWRLRQTRMNAAVRKDDSELSRRVNDLNEQLRRTRTQNDDLRSLLGAEQQRSKAIQGQIDALSAERGELTQQKVDILNTLSDARRNEAEAKAKEEGLRNQIKMLSESLESAKQNNDSLMGQLNALSNDDSMKQKVDLENELRRLDIEKAQRQKKLDEIVNAIKDAETQKLAIEGDKNQWGQQLKITNSREKHLIDIMREISDTYPELEEQLAKIEWKEIWLPKMQALVKALGANKRGIYVIRWEHDGSVDMYYGQAVNIKDRWYDHARKIIGATKKGNELLYNCGARIEELWWSVVNKNEDVDDLDEREKMYINAAGTLNKKG